MSPRARDTRRVGMSRGAALALVCALACPGAALAVRTKTWKETPGELQRGEADGIAVTARGRLFLAPRLRRLGGEGPSGATAHVWAVASDRKGNVYFGTGPEGRVLKVSPASGTSVLFTVDEPMVTALAVLPGGDLLAGTAPGGKIYRIAPDGVGDLWAETGERYVWSLAVGKDGSVFAGTGEQGLVFRLNRSGEAERFFDSDEPHITALLCLDDGDIVAGGAGRGLVYRVNGQGHAVVLHDDELPEVADIVRERNGDLVAALLAPPEPEPRPPEVRIQIPGAAPVGARPESVKSELEERSTPALEGIIEGLSVPAEPRGRRVRGRVVRITRDGSVTELWRSSSEAPYCLALDGDDRAVFGAGEPARVYRTDGSGDVELLATLREAQVTGLVRAGAPLVAATSNPAAAYAMDNVASESGEFLSRPFDALAPATWGTIRWRVEGPSGGRVELYTRSGNSADPDATWSAWSPALTDSAGARIVNPDARFLQWRARLVGAAASGARLSDVSVTFVPYNRPPSVEGFRLDAPEPAVSGVATFRWNALDPDGDPVEMHLQYREEGASEWKSALRAGGPGSEGTPSESPEGWNPGEAAWDTHGVAEGRYEVRGLANDRASNAPGAGKEIVAGSPMPVVIDRTAPQVDTREVSGGLLEVTIVDPLSGVRRLEVLGEEGVLFVPASADGVCDSSKESFRLEGLEAAGARGLRAADFAGNVSETRLFAP